MAQKKAIKFEFVKIDELDTELKANRGELPKLLQKAKLLLSELDSLRDSYADLSALYDSMANAARQIGDSALSGRILKSLNEARDGYRDANNLYQKLK